MKNFIESVVLVSSALTFFGGFKTEKEGLNKGKLNIKQLGWAALILCSQDGFPCEQYIRTKYPPCSVSRRYGK